MDAIRTRPTSGNMLCDVVSEVLIWMLPRLD
jgi:hypothetical protein